MAWRWQSLAKRCISRWCHGLCGDGVEQAENREKSCEGALVRHRGVNRTELNKLKIERSPVSWVGETRRQCHSTLNKLKIERSPVRKRTQPQRVTEVQLNKLKIERSPVRGSGSSISPKSIWLNKLKIERSPVRLLEKHPRPIPGQGEAVDIRERSCELSGRFHM